ncbi:MAG: murein hydrolase activator EnvC family protein [Pseudanabaenaceae cyanobacterium]
MTPIRLSLALLVVIFWCLYQTGAASANQWQDYHRWLQQQRAIVRERRQRIEQIEGPAEQRLEQLRQSVKVTEAQIETTAKQLKQAQALLKNLNQQLAITTANLEQQRLATKARLRYLARHPQHRWWMVLLNTPDLQHLIDRRRQLQRIYQRDRQLLTNLQASAQRVANRRQLVIAQENEIALLQQKLLTQKAQLQGEVVVQERAIAKLKSDRQALESAEQRLAEDSMRLQRLIIARAGTPQNFTIVPGTGRLQYPTYGTISSPYGWRIHPILGYEKLHTGIDIAADTGTPIYAADTGTVILAEWYGGYGYTVIIAHGNEISTLYAHCSEIYVTVGQVVQKGQIIAAVGSTGFSTGPHLHFEVRFNGEPIDPMPYL